MSSVNESQTLAKKKKAALLAGIIVGQAAFIYSNMVFNKQAQHTSILSGHTWIQELLKGHPARIRYQLGMNQHIFLKLVKKLQLHTNLEPTRHMSQFELLGIFLYITVHNSSIRDASERFQRSSETISR